jgi:hypothetical protein
VRERYDDRCAAACQVKEWWWGHVPDGR